VEKDKSLRRETSANTTFVPLGKHNRKLWRRKKKTGLYRASVGKDVKATPHRKIYKHVPNIQR